ncbi:uncharacterized protein (DUF2126 family) [Granulicella aggregans]|uniref:Uncharacterized protein (DUF2126 family) n=1 Tax=Granulicella aggregans TaxID=474949 RepID=A0A7W8E2D8_9BACT|nr:transglutaminase family protein [Granulicella aggregans]MBB5056251.1 uncharacterized protein (DUF2126 family) [Granulicella aggregans]
MDKTVELHHRTAYRYERPVSFGPQVIQLRPAPHCATPIIRYALKLKPAEHILNWQFDPLGNHLARVIFPQKVSEFVVDVTLVADMTPINPFAFFLDPGFETFPFEYPDDLAQNLEPYRSIAPAGPLFKALLREIPLEPQSTVAFVGSLAARVRDRIGYTVRLEQGVQTCEQTLDQLTGSCRDSAWLLVQLFRSRGLAARFVSGYLIQLAPDNPGNADPAAPKTDSADLHAWAEVFLPGAGWIGVDPTSGLFTAEGHIPLVCTPNPSQAAPIGGTVEPAKVDFSFNVSVRRLNEAPNLAKPFSDEQWAKVREVAHEVDRRLADEGVGLTMGGEPTFVGVDEPESGQWNLEALGAIKRTRALILIRRLRERTAPGGLLHFGQGKWYPGEPLPRWAYLCVSRVDGVPIWENGNLIAWEDDVTSFGIDDSRRFLEALSHRLQVTRQSILPAFEPGQADEPTGYILPLRRRQPEGRLAWSSQLWFERPERLILFPGDSPIGYRITADLVPFVAPDELTYETEELPASPARHPELFAIEPNPDLLPPLSSTAETAPELIRPALCVQAVEGRLHVFLPYTPVAADYLDLIAAVEDTCKHLGMPVWLEGYPPPYDPRLRFYGLTPDPGVLEVNLPPTANWDDLEELNAILHEETHGNRLIAGKFAYDGSHLSTGGGSHIVLGGKSVTESPVLRRPDLLRSMVTFWQRHPSLSYLFSGMYVGPTSQHPRVDEARVDALYELEVAFSQLTGGDVPPYILDGLFRNLLVDVTGNTHRAEFCIDKMYPPEGQGLRLGLLELRAFEMPPHFRMGLVQMLLVRALVSTLWKQPFTGELIRWEGTLHDRYMLPHFVHDDFKEVLRYLRSVGLEFEESWFRTHLEFRFPKIGSVTAEGVTLELRQALEPWNVLAEETSAGGTGRSVDSSLERMQLKVAGLPSGSRFVVSCNGRRVPLTSTGAEGEAIAGIRYRARRLAATLHPTIPIHTPLTFDLIDTWKNRAIARCTYFSAAPDGTIYTARPRDAEEAKIRKLQRFVVSEPPSEPMLTPPEEKNPVYPMTLDLRFPAPGASLDFGPKELVP